MRFVLGTHDRFLRFTLSNVAPGMRSRFLLNARSGVLVRILSGSEPDCVPPFRDHDVLDALEAEGDGEGCSA